MEPPEDFLNWAWGPMTNREWAERCGVSETTIWTWKRKYAAEIMERRGRKENRP